MKKFTAILFAGLLVWMQFASAPASTMVCAKAIAAKCGMACGGQMMACCGTNAPTPPATPPPTASGQNEISLLAPAVLAWILPARPANLPAVVNVSPLMAAAAPLYTRDCALLI